MFFVLKKKKSCLFSSLQRFSEISRVQIRLGCDWAHKKRESTSTNGLKDMKIIIFFEDATMTDQEIDHSVQLYRNMS